MVIKTMLDFTLQEYKKLCLSINRSIYKPVTVEKYISGKNLTENFLILRHDVDRKPERAEKMATIENGMGFKATYYFRKNSHVFKPDLIKNISEMGHEIGYHYEVLDKVKGNIGKAYLIFKEELTAFRNIVDIKTVAMHGNPLTRWINSDFWKSYSLDEFNLIGEAYLSIKNKDIIYLNDTGRSWDPLKHNKKDFLQNSNKTIIDKLQKTDDLIGLIRKPNGKNQLYLSIHPNRWVDDPLSWSIQFIEDHLINQIKFAAIFFKRESKAQ